MGIKYGQMGLKTRTKLHERGELVSKQELGSIMHNSFSFFDFNELRSLHGKSIFIKGANLSNLTYSDLQFVEKNELEPKREAYQKIEDLICGCVLKFIDKMTEDECIVRSYGDKWFYRRIITATGGRVLPIFRSYKGGVKVEKGSVVIESYVRSVLRYNSFLQFLFPKDQAILSPTDHMDLFVDYADEEQMLTVAREVWKDEMISNELSYEILKKIEYL